MLRMKTDAQVCAAMPVFPNMDSKTTTHTAWNMIPRYHSTFSQCLYTRHCTSGFIWQYKCNQHISTLAAVLQRQLDASSSLLTHAECSSACNCCHFWLSLCACCSCFWSFSFSTCRSAEGADSVVTSSAKILSVELWEGDWDPKCDAKPDMYTAPLQQFELNQRLTQARCTAAWLLAGPCVSTAAYLRLEHTERTAYMGPSACSKSAAIAAVFLQCTPSLCKQQAHAEPVYTTLWDTL